MNQKELQTLLQQPYNSTNWQRVLEDIFPSVSFLKNPERIEINNETVQSFNQTGLVRLQDGKNLAVFEVVLDEGINLLRNRVTLRNLTTKFIDEANTHGVLVIYDQGKNNYRFTFVAKESGFNESGKWVQFETASKRYTYILGEGESCRTAAERFSRLAQKRIEVGLPDVIDAFSVEQLSKEFFSNYVEHYNQFCNYIHNSNFLPSIFNGNEKDVRDFVKKMMGRIVFLYFLQKKGWLGATDNRFIDGDLNFMNNFWEGSEKDEAFYNNHLKRLFHEGLNKERQHNEFLLPNGIKTKVPYLNGGLFDMEHFDNKIITFPKYLFENLFDFLSRYNFTIDENDPEENEIGIDPEMLGHIFENLLEDNKDKGAFYTPKEIVKYMTQESLTEYLIVGLKSDNNDFDEDDVKSLRFFVKHKLRGDEVSTDQVNNNDLVNFYQTQIEFIKKYGNKLNKLLDNVKICDPAIGSGAFPVGLLNEIFQCKLVLNNTYSAQERFELKKHIIENSIYGVDIEKGAVDIARLRFWLSLIIEQQYPTPLPNLDYKIVVGNSLVGKLDNEIIEIDWELKDNSHGLFGQGLFKQKMQLLERISKLQKEYFSPESNKEILSSQIRSMKIDLLMNQLELMIKSSGQFEIPIQTNYSKKKNFIEATIKYNQTLIWKKTIDKLLRLRKNNKDLNYFDWRLDFPEVLNSEISGKEGFDIVIANPPYISIRTKHFDTSLKELFKQKYQLAVGQYDIYVLFLEKTYYLLTKNGIMSYIIPKRMLSNENFENARKFVLEYIPIYEYVDAEMPFENANVEANIMLGRKNKNVTQIHSFRYNHREKEFNDVCTISSDAIQQMPFSIFPFVFNRDKLNILFNIQKQNLSPLSEFLEITRGFECGYGDESIGEEVTEYKLLPAESLSPYFVNEANHIYCKPNFKNTSKFKKKELFESTPKLLTKFTSNRIQFSLDNVGFYNTNSVYNCHLRDNSPISYFYLLAVLNSNLISFWFNTAFLNVDTLFPHIQKNQLESIPILIPQENKVKIILEELAEKIMQNGRSEESKLLMMEVDSYIYRLYGLEYDEVRIIDPEFGYAKSEYESILTNKS